MGLRAKLTQNLILGNLLQAFNEGLVLSTKAGVDPELMLDILNNSAARSGFHLCQSAHGLQTGLLYQLLSKMAGKRYWAGRGPRLRARRPLMLTGLTQQLFQAAMAKGYGEDDICGSIRVLEELAGVRSRRRALLHRSFGRCSMWICQKLLRNAVLWAIQLKVPSIGVHEVVALDFAE